MLTVKDRLSSVMSKKSQLQKQIENTHMKNVEQQALPGQKVFDFMAFAEEKAPAMQVLSDELS